MKYNKLIGQEIKVLVNDQLTLVGHVKSIEDVYENEVDMIVEDSTGHEYIIQIPLEH